ncbi:hypothetical protein VDGD_21479 [Verticillium dahliae]|nr:hypothetical protein VDGD_21479 [Verticillium dahliae]
MSRNGPSWHATRYALWSGDSLTCLTDDHAGTANVSRAVHRNTLFSPAGVSTSVRPVPS